MAELHGVPRREWDGVFIDIGVAIVHDRTGSSRALWNHSCWRQFEVREM